MRSSLLFSALRSSSHHFTTYHTTYNKVEYWRLSKVELWPNPNRVLVPQEKCYGNVENFRANRISTFSQHYYFYYLRVCQPDILIFCLYALVLILFILLIVFLSSSLSGGAHLEMSSWRCELQSAGLVGPRLEVNAWRYTLGSCTFGGERLIKKLCRAMIISLISF